MTIQELKDFLATLPEEFNNYELVNGEVVIVDEEHYGRVDKPIVTIHIDEETEEMIFYHSDPDGLFQDELN